MFSKPLTTEIINKLKNDFYSNAKNRLAQNACTAFDPYDIAVNKRVVEASPHVYNIKVESEASPVTNQESSGRCWLFAALNVMRLPFMRKYKIDEFEFSQTYLFFWDKIERSHYWLNSIVATAKEGEKVEDRLVNHLLQDPINDGGQWDMIVNLVNKYGLVPKKYFPDTFSSKRSARMNAILKTKLREFAKDLRNLVDKDASNDDLQLTIGEQTAIIYNIVSTCLGTPPDTIKFEYYNKEKEYLSFDTVTPLDFYNNYVRPLFNVDDKVCLVSDPRPSNPFGHLYTVHCLGNMVGGRKTIYNNQPIEVLIDVAKESLKGGEAVWFGCDTVKRFERNSGLQDLEAQDYRLIFNTEIQIGMDKAHRLLYADSCMIHAMVFTACGTDEQGNATRFRVENSYGDKEYDKGYIRMSVPWFKEFVFEVVVDKKYVPQDVLDVFKKEPKLLPAWDPMGTLACVHCSKE